MNNKSKTLPGQNKAPWRVFLLIAFLTALVTSCAHQPWDIDTYIKNLERPERDVDQQPEKVVEALDLKPGMVVADVGAGSGYFTRRFAKAVGGTGQVIVVDIEQKMLAYNKQELEKLGMADRARFILAKPDDPSLSENSVDLVFLCNAVQRASLPICAFGADCNIRQSGLSLWA